MPKAANKHFSASESDNYGDLGSQRERGERASAGEQEGHYILFTFFIQPYQHLETTSTLPYNQICFGLASYFTQA